MQSHELSEVTQRLVAADPVEREYKDLVASCHSLIARERTTALFR